MLLLLFDASYSVEQKAIILLILLGLLGNAFICGAGSGVYNRYQSRIAWLITLPAS